MEIDNENNENINFNNTKEKEIDLKFVIYKDYAIQCDNAAIYNVNNYVNEIFYLSENKKIKKLIFRYSMINSLLPNGDFNDEANYFFEFLDAAIPHSIEYLDFSCNFYYIKLDSYIRYKAFSDIISQLPNLKYLCLNGTDITTDIIADINFPISLNTLLLNDTNLTIYNFNFLCNVTNLTTLDLSCINYYF